MRAEGARAPDAPRRAARGLARFFRTRSHSHVAAPATSLTTSPPLRILACTDDNEAIAYLDRVDRNCPRVDVTDDFVSERHEVLRAQGPGFHFTFGDYVVKALLGAVDPMFDGLDEQKGWCSIA